MAINDDDFGVNPRNNEWEYQGPKKSKEKIKATKDKKTGKLSMKVKKAERKE